MSILAFQMPEKVVMEKADDFHGLFTFKPLEKGTGLPSEMPSEGFFCLHWKDMLLQPLNYPV